MHFTSPLLVKFFLESEHSDVKKMAKTDQNLYWVAMAPLVYPTGILHLHVNLPPTQTFLIFFPQKRLGEIRRVRVGAGS